MGYCGGELARQALSGGHEVWGVRRGPEFPQGVRGVRLDLTSPEADLSPLPESADAIVYAVGAGAHDEASYERAYVAGLRRTLEHYERSLSERRTRLLFTSSTAVFGASEGWLDEESPADADTFSARILRRAEELTEQVGGTVLRLGGIYGPGRASMVGRIQRGELSSDSAPDRYTNRIHRDDVAGALLHLCALPAPAPLYLGVDEDPARLVEVVRWLEGRLTSDGRLPAAAGTAPRLPAKRARQVASKRCSSALLRAHGYCFRFPTFREGYAELLRASV